MRDTGLERGQSFLDASAEQILRDDRTETATARLSIAQLSAPELSEDALALDFVSSHGKSFRWSPGIDWMRLGTCAWERDDGLTRYDLARRICRAAATAAKDAEAKRLASSKTVNGVLTLAKTDPRIVLPVAAWDGDPMMLNTPGGIVDLKTGVLRQRRHTDYVTQFTVVTPDFNMGAPVFHLFMDEIFLGDRDVVEFVQRVLGYALTGDRREQVLFFLHGHGANGKSTLVDLVQDIMGSYSINVASSALMSSRNERHPTELAQLRGKRLAISSELEEGQFWNETLVKNLTGDATLSARFMRQDFFEFQMTQKHIIIGNHKPHLRGNDPAMARRLILIPFRATFNGASRDNLLAQKLKAEAPGILAWMIEGTRKWLDNGLMIPAVIRDASADYMAAQDDIALWMDECCERVGEDRADALYSSFKLWKESRGEHPMAMRGWGERMNIVPGIGKRRSNGYHYTGICLTTEERSRVRYAKGGI